jgi:hypothetical protein
MPVKSAKNAKKMETTYPLKIQAIRSRGQQPRLYVSFPLALAAAIGLGPGGPRPVGTAGSERTASGPVGSPTTRSQTPSAQKPIRKTIINSGFPELTRESAGYISVTS